MIKLSVAALCGLACPPLLTYNVALGLSAFIMMAYLILKQAKVIV